MKDKGNFAMEMNQNFLNDSDDDDKQPMPESILRPVSGISKRSSRYQQEQQIETEDAIEDNYDWMLKKSSRIWLQEQFYKFKGFVSSKWRNF